MKLSRRGGSIPGSVTLAINARAKELAAEGHRVIRFGVGEPDFDTPEHIKEAARLALQGRINAYTPVAGVPELREEVARTFRECGISAEASNVVVSCGAKQSLFNALQVLVDDGDEVAFYAPYWVSYPPMTTAAGGTPVVIDTSADGCRLTPEPLRAALTDRTRVLLLNSPSNPTGITATRDELAALGEVLADFPEVVVLSDEIYQHLVYGDAEFVPFAVACPAVAERTITVNGVSKSFAMTGWRIGYATGPAQVIAAMTRYQSHSTSNPTAIAQAAALAALRGPMEPIEEMRQAFDRRRLLMTDKLRALPGTTLTPPDGAFYCWPEVSGWLGEGGTTLQLAEDLLEQARVAVVPGEAFGAPGYLRLSYACSEEDIEEGCARIQAFLERSK